MRGLLLAGAIVLAGCGAGTADVPADLPAPKPLAGGSAEEVAKSKGLKGPTQQTHMSRTFNPTNPGP